MGRSNEFPQLTTTLSTMGALVQHVYTTHNKFVGGKTCRTAGMYKGNKLDQVRNRLHKNTALYEKKQLRSHSKCSDELGGQGFIVVDGMLQSSLDTPRKHMRNWSSQPGKVSKHVYRLLPTVGPALLLPLTKQYQTTPHALGS